MIKILEINEITYSIISIYHDFSDFKSLRYWLYKNQYTYMFFAEDIFFTFSSFDDYPNYMCLPICIKIWDNHNKENDFVINALKNEGYFVFIVDPGYKKEEYRFWSRKHNVWYVVKYEYYKIQNNYVLIKIEDEDENNLGYCWKYIRKNNYGKKFNCNSTILTRNMIEEGLKIESNIPDRIKRHFVRYLRNCKAMIGTNFFYLENEEQSYPIKIKFELDNYYLLKKAILQMHNYINNIIDIVE